MARGRRPSSTGVQRGTGESSSVGPKRASLDPDPDSVARAIGLRMLTMAPRSRHQLAEAFGKQGVPAGAAERVLDRFTEAGLVDDAEYARMLVRSQHAARGLVGRALRFELRKRGIDDELAEAAIAELTAEQEEATARALLARTMRSVVALGRDAQLRRLSGLLTRKGYSPSVVVRLVREMVDDGLSSDATEVESWEM